MIFLIFFKTYLRIICDQITDFQFQAVFNKVRPRTDYKYCALASQYSRGISYNYEYEHYQWRILSCRASHYVGIPWRPRDRDLDVDTETDTVLSARVLRYSNR